MEKINELQDAVRQDDGGLDDFAVNKIWVNGATLYAHVSLGTTYRAVHGYNEKGLFVNPLKAKRGKAE